MRKLLVVGIGIGVGVRVRVRVVEKFELVQTRLTINVK